MEKDFTLTLAFPGPCLGSSAALTAAIYSRYGAQLQKRSLCELRSIFSRMESYFHGQSSGIDPIVCYMGRSFLFRSKDDIVLKNINFFQRKKSSLFFLLNTKKKRKVKLLFKNFTQKYESSDGQNIIRKK